MITDNRDNPLILIYIACSDEADAMRIGKHLLQKRLCGCINIIPAMHSLYFWPPRSGQFEEAHEAVLIVKTIGSKYRDVETEVKRIHTYECPCIMSIPVSNVSKQYYDWIINEID